MDSPPVPPGLVPRGDASATVSRALVLSNGALGAEGQCLGLVRALGFGAPGSRACDVHLVGEAALALAPRLGAAWSERLSRSAGAVGMVKRGGPRPAPLPWYLARLAGWIRALPASWHVWLHAAWDVVFPSGHLDETWLGADLRPLVAAAMEHHRDARLGRTLVVASGRGAVPACVAMKRRCGDAVFAVVVQHPRCDFRRFDLVVAPRHDFPDVPDVFSPLHAAEGVDSARVCVTRAALHRLDRDAIAAARERWRREFLARPGPRLAVCVGGPTRHCALGGRRRDAETANGASARLVPRFVYRYARRLRSAVTDPLGRGAERAFAEEVVDFVVRATRGADDREGIADQPRHSETALFGSAFVTFSRRTPASLRTAMRRRFAIHADARRRADSKPAAANASARDAPTVAKTSRLWVWDERGPNPFEGAMAWADAVLVTADSASVLSEAASLGVPVIVAGWRGAEGKAATLTSALAAAGVARPMEDVALDANAEGGGLWSVRGRGVDDAAAAARRVEEMVDVRPRRAGGSATRRETDDSDANATRRRLTFRAAEKTEDDETDGNG